MHLNMHAPCTHAGQGIGGDLRKPLSWAPQRLYRVSVVWERGAISASGASPGVGEWECDCLPCEWQGCVHQYDWIYLCCLDSTGTKDT